ncbi:LVIVD repeat-containing protein [Salinigranum sp.]|uniref:LVIVD repeat-containing protein n=1 Tax=Salinigranum sp. TaxID=1966351 RepID=UPI00356411D9
MTDPRYGRRTALKLLGATAALGGVGTAAARRQEDKPKKGRLKKLGHSLLSDPPGGYTEGSIRSDGQYGVLGSFLGEGGSFLVDLSNPRDPTEVHRVPSSADTRNADVKFDHRDGLYYRTQEPNNEVGEGGIELVDYGWGDGTPEEPVVLSKLEADPTHNVFAHPEEPVLYATNEEEADGGLEVWDVSDPAAPSLVGSFGPKADLHDVVVDPERDYAHLAFIGGDRDEDAFLDGYVLMDVSDPMAPEEVGRFDYESRPDYTEKRLGNGEPGFESCHYADYDPERGLVVVGDEIGLGVPGGKHVLDIGWGDGTPEEPKHVGFTYSPNAEVMDEGIEFLDWTTHNHDIVPKGDTTILVDGGYREGVWAADISDPTDPTPTDRYATLDKVDEANGMLIPENPPVAWSADYNRKRDLTLVADQVTGVYTFRAVPKPSSPDDAGGNEGRGNDNGRGNGRNRDSGKEDERGHG